MELENYITDDIHDLEVLAEQKHFDEEVEEMCDDYEKWRNRKFLFHIAPWHLTEPLDNVYITVTYQVNKGLYHFKILPFEYTIMPALAPFIKWSDKLDREIIEAAKGNYSNYYK
jgi:hypothetical protein